MKILLEVFVVSCRQLSFPKKDYYIVIHFFLKMNHYANFHQDLSFLWKPLAKPEKQPAESLTDFLKKPLVYHSLFWIAYFIFNTLRWGFYFDDYLYSLKSNIVEFPIHVLLVYFNIYYLLKKVLPKSLARYIIYLLLSILMMSMVRILLTYSLVTTEVWRESVIPVESPFGFNYILAVYLGELYFVGLITAIYLIIGLISSKKHMLELQQRNHETELSFLRSQVQPHFFFNTLNSLYSLSLEKSDKAPETVLKLSELMSYVIYKGKHNLVDLGEEVEHINNYIDLENLRFGDKLEASLSISGDITGKQIPPLILMPFVENCFKHGIQYRNGKIPIKIGLQVVSNDLVFTTKNPVGPSVQKPSECRALSGIGIQNTKRRLELIYGKNYTLEVNQQSDYFLITLKIKLYEN